MCGLYAFVLHTYLQRVPFPAEEGQVVLQRPALLALVLEGRPAADVEHAQPKVGRVVGVDDRVPAGRARRDRLRVVRRVLERQVRIVEPVHRAELVAQVDAGLVVGQVGGKVRRTDGTARRDRVLVTVAQAQLEQVGVAGLETQLAEVELLVERHVVRSVVRAELRRQRIGVEHIRPRHVARHDEILGLVQHEEVQLVADDRPAERRAVLLGELLGLEAAILLDRRRLTACHGGAVPNTADPEFIEYHVAHSHNHATPRGMMKSLVSYSMKKCSLARMIGPLNVAPYCSVSSSVLKPRSSSIGDGSRQASEVRSQKKLPRNSLVPDLVTATTAALLIWSYSAL